MVPDLPRRFRSQRLPARGQRGQACRALIFQVYKSAAFQPVAGSKLSQALRQGVLPERWIKKNKVERLAGRAQKARSAQIKHAPAHLAAKALQLRSQRVGGSRRGLDKYDFGCAPGQGLETQCTGSGEQVQAARTGNFMLQPVEQRLADPVGCRPEGWQIGKLDSAPSPYSADDANRVAGGGGRHFRIIPAKVCAP